MKFPAIQYGGFRLLSALAQALPKAPPNRFLILSSGRSGSNLLVSLLRSHRNVRAFGEVLGQHLLQHEVVRRDIRRIGTQAYVDLWLRRQGLESAVGIKALYQNLEPEFFHKQGLIDVQPSLDVLREDQELRVLHLKRRDRLAVVVSWHLARMTGRFLDKGSTGSLSTSEPKISLDADELRSEFEQLEATELKYDQTFSSHRMLDICYEDLVARGTAEHERILDFLGVPRQSLASETRKQRRRPLSQVIENYEDLKAQFAGERWAAFFP